MTVLIDPILISNTSEKTPSACTPSAEDDDELVKAKKYRPVLSTARFVNAHRPVLLLHVTVTVPSSFPLDELVAESVERRNTAVMVVVVNGLEA